MQVNLAYFFTPRQANQFSPELRKTGKRVGSQYASRKSVEKADEFLQDDSAIRALIEVLLTL